MSSMSKATRAVLTNVGAGMAVSAFHALVSARTPLTMTGTLSQVNRSQGHGAMSTFKADTGFKLRPPRSPRPYSAVITGSVKDSSLLHYIYKYMVSIVPLSCCLFSSLHSKGVEIREDLTSEPPTD